MDGFTPTFFLQVLIAFGSAGAIYGAIKADLKNMHARIEEQATAARDHRKEDDDSFHDIRNELQGHHGRIARMEGQNDLAERVVAALKH